MIIQIRITQLQTRSQQPIYAECSTFWDHRCRGDRFNGFATGGFIQITFPEVILTSVASATKTNTVTYSWIGSTYGTDMYIFLTIDGEAYTWTGKHGVQRLDLPTGFLAVAADLGEEVTCLAGLDCTLRCCSTVDYGLYYLYYWIDKPTCSPKDLVLIP